MISSWKELSFESFEELYLKDFWDLKLKDIIIELKNPMICHYGGYAGIFIGSLQGLDISIFEELSVDFPGISELRKVKNMMLSLDSKKEDVDNAYDSVLRDIIIGRDFPLFMLTAYSPDSAAHLYPIGNNESDKIFLNSIFSFEAPKNSVLKSSSNRGVLYVKEEKERFTGNLYLSNYYESKPELFVSCRVWDKKAFNQFAKLLRNEDFKNSDKVKEFMSESINLYNKSINYKLIDDKQ